MDEEKLISVPIEIEDSVSSTASDPIEVKKVKVDYKFKKRLIAQVQKHGILYDNKNKKFTNVAEKEKAWLKIAIALTTEVNVCKNTWVDLRYDYQRYARRLRKFFNHGNKNNKRRPIMAMETDMIFLWRFVANKSLYPLPTDENNENAATVTAQPAAEDDDIVLLEDDPIVVIDLDGDDDNNTNQNNILSAHRKHLNRHEVRRLVGLVKVYQELYNSQHRYYNDVKRKGTIWNAIANELGNKATKLMKNWIYMQTRYEWELNHLQKSRNATETKFQKLLEFLSSHMLNNPNTVYKHSFYLKKDWQEPIQHFKSIFSLLAAMKKMPEIVTLTDELLHVQMKNNKYFKLWHDVAKIRGISIGRCETTWLILRSFYWELKNMRTHNYQLQDKWYFESIITEIYTLAEVAKPAPAKPAPAKPAPAKLKPPPVRESITETPVTVNIDEDKILSTTIETKQHQLLNSTYPNVFVNNEHLKLPSILSAKILVPPKIHANKSYPGTGLKITPITSPIAAAAAYNAGEPPPLSLNSSPSSSSIVFNKNIVPINLPYQLPQNTKVTAFTTSATATVSTATSSMTENITIKPVIESISLNTDIVTAAETTETSAPVPMGDPTYKPIVPKTAGTVSILNSNAIMIKLISSAKGKQLVIHGSPLTDAYSISMGTTAKFIREVMAIPVLHNKLINDQAQANGYWHYLSKKMNLPVHICKAIWNFLSKNFNNFPQIAPMYDLMQPFKIGIKVWKESYQLFNSFHGRAVLAGFRAYKQQLPEIMQHIRSYFTFTQQNGKNQPIVNFDAHIQWPTMIVKFPTIDKYKMMEMWIAFKKVFWQYMCELESGIDNKWHQEWWHVLANLKFLSGIRYHNQEPFYYIVRNKITEEIERCSFYEIKMNSKTEKMKKQCLLKAKHPQTVNTVSPSPPIANNSANSINYNLNNSITTATHKSLNVSSTTPPPLVSIVPELPSSSQAQINTTKVHNRADIDAYTLILAIRRYPQIYQRSRSADKVKAWKDIAVELNTSISSCRLAFQRAVRNYRTYVARDTANRCRFNQRYFKHLHEIYRVVMATKKQNIKTPTELNQSMDLDLTESNKINFPERFILDINMDSVKPALVMKNWAFAIGNISQNTDQVFEDKLRQIFSKFLPQVNV